MSRSFTVQPHAEELRDPTRDELFNGPTREKLPEAIQKMDSEDTACTFCGVSYFVFSEVQELQATVKKYKTTFRDFVRFMERERRTSQTLKEKVYALKTQFDHAAQEFSTKALQLAQENVQSRHLSEALTQQLRDVESALTQARDEHVQLASQFRCAEESWMGATALTEQKCRNELLHLSSQIENCKLVSSAQEAEFAAEMARETAKRQELEVLLTTERTAFGTTNLLVVTERDDLKQQLLAANERVEMERSTAKELEAQLRAVKQELQRVLANSESHRSSCAQLQNELGVMKAKLQRYEQLKASVIAECTNVRSELDESNELAQNLHAQIATLQTQIGVNATITETIKQEHVKNLEKLRLEHGTTIAHLQRDHQKAMNDMRDKHKTYVEYLQKQTSKHETSASAKQNALLVMEQGRRDAESQVHRLEEENRTLKHQLQCLQVNEQQANARSGTLEQKLVVLEDEKRDLSDEIGRVKNQLIEAEVRAKRQLEQAGEDAKKFQSELTEANNSLQKRLDGVQKSLDRTKREHNDQITNLQAEIAQARREATSVSSPSARREAWRENPGVDKKSKNATSSHRDGNNNNNQEHHELEKLVDKLRVALEQKEQEISLLQQTVHRECMERTSLLERMRSGKVLPDLMPCSIGAASTEKHHTRAHDPIEHGEGDNTEGDDCGGGCGSGGESGGPPKASLYERLRRAGQRKKQSRKG